MSPSQPAAQEEPEEPEEPKPVEVGGSDWMAVWIVYVIHILIYTYYHVNSIVQYILINYSLV